MKRLGTTAAVLLTVGAMAAPASAGEITGNGKDTPIRSGVAASICAFSGLDETGDEGDEFFERTQNYGQLVRQGLAPSFPHPKDTCNPNAGGPE